MPIIIWSAFLIKMKLLFKIDLYLTQFMNKFVYRNSYLSSFLSYITHTSGGRTYILYFLIIPFLPNLTNNIISTDLANFLWVYGGPVFIFFQVPMYFLLKYIFKRERPYLYHDVTAIISPPDKFSFPSGHSASATLLTLIIIQQTSILAPYFIVWMLIIFLSRVGLGLHYASDILFGIALGTLSFFVVLQLSQYDLSLSHEIFESLSSFYN